MLCEGNGLFAEDCGHGVSEGGEMLGRIVGDGLEEGVFEVGKGGLLLENVCWIILRTRVKRRGSRSSLPSAQVAIRVLQQTKR